MHDPLRCLVYNLYGPSSLVIFDLVADVTVAINGSVLAIRAHLPVHTVREICTKLENANILSKAKHEGWWMFDRLFALESAKAVAWQIVMDCDKQRQDDPPISYRCERCGAVSFWEDVVSSLFQGVSPTCCDRDMVEHVVAERSATVEEHVREILSDLDACLLMERQRSCRHDVRS